MAILANAPNNELALTIAGKQHHDWKSYEVDSDLLIAADAWQFDISPTSLVLPEFINIGADVRLTLDGKRILTGVIDDVTESIAKNQHIISLSGRDLAGQLLDCSVPLFDGQEL